MSKSSDVNKWFNQSVFFISLMYDTSFINPFRFSNRQKHTSRYDLAQSAVYSKNPIIINPFWEKASAETPLKWSIWAAIHEIAVFAKNGIEVRNLLKAKTALLEPAKPIYEVEITDETEAQKKNLNVRNQKKRVAWDYRVQKPEKRASCVTRFLGTRLVQNSATFNKRGQASTCTALLQKSS